MKDSPEPAEGRGIKLSGDRSVWTSDVIERFGQPVIWIQFCRPPKGSEEEIHTDGKVITNLYLSVEAALALSELLQIHKELSDTYALAT